MSGLGNDDVTLGEWVDSIETENKIDTADKPFTDFKKALFGSKGFLRSNTLDEVSVSTSKEEIKQIFENVDGVRGYVAKLIKRLNPYWQEKSRNAQQGSAAQEGKKKLEEIEEKLKITTKGLNTTAASVALVARTLGSEHDKRKDHESKTKRKHRSLRYEMSDRIDEQAEQNAKIISGVKGNVENLQKRTDDNFTLIRLILQIGVFCTLLGVIFVSCYDLVTETRNSKSAINAALMFFSAGLQWIIKKNKYCCVLNEKFIVGLQLLRGSLIDAAIIFISRYFNNGFGQESPAFVGVMTYVFLLLCGLYLFYWNVSELRTILGNVTKWNCCGQRETIAMMEVSTAHEQNKSDGNGGSTYEVGSVAKTDTGLAIPLPVPNDLNRNQSDSNSTHSHSNEKNMASVAINMGGVMAVTAQ